MRTWSNRPVARMLLTLDRRSHRSGAIHSRASSNTNPLADLPTRSPKAMRAVCRALDCGEAITSSYSQVLRSMQLLPQQPSHGQGRPAGRTSSTYCGVRSSSCCSQKKALAERRCEARNRSEVIFPPADLSDSDRESLTMVVKDSVPVAKIRSRYAPLQLHRAPADHRLRRMRSEGHRTRISGCTWAYGRGLGC